MHAQDLLVDHRGDGEAVEAVCEGLPQLDRVASLALVVEAVDPVDRGALVVAAKKEEVLWVLDLVGEQQADRLKALLPWSTGAEDCEVGSERWIESLLHSPPSFPLPLPPRLPPSPRSLDPLSHNPPPFLPSNPSPDVSEEKKWSGITICYLCRRSLQERGSWSQAGSRRTRTVGEDRNTVRASRLRIARAKSRNE